MHTVDSVSEKGAKHVEHRTSIGKLVPTATRKALEALAKEGATEA